MWLRFTKRTFARSGCSLPADTLPAQGRSGGHFGGLGCRWALRMLPSAPPEWLSPETRSSTRRMWRRLHRCAAERRGDPLRHLHLEHRRWPHGVHHGAALCQDSPRCAAPPPSRPHHCLPGNFRPLAHKTLARCRMVQRIQRSTAAEALRSSCGWQLRVGIRMRCT